MAGVWQLQEAKNRFSEVVNRAVEQGPQIVTRHGRKAVVILDYQEYRRLKGREGNLADFLLNSPFAGSELPIERDRSLPSQIDLEP